MLQAVRFCSTAIASIRFSPAVYSVAAMSSSPTVSLPEVSSFSIRNDPVLTYLKGSKERAELEDALKRAKGQVVDVPIVIGDREIRRGEAKKQVMPFDHGTTIANFYWASKEDIQAAIASSLSARASWEATPISHRISLFLKAADLVSQKYHMELNAATMLGQAKNVFQAEIDSAAELADFLRFNAHFATELLHYQPISEDPKVTLNRLRFRGLEGFVAAISPFNFTAIGGNLASAPTLMGNVVVWKPSDTAILSNYTIFKIFREAGFPPGVINFVPADGPTFGDAITASPDLAGINFTGSVPTFRHLWRQVGENLPLYKNFPRLVGEVGGKNFHFVHSSADVRNVVLQTLRAAFEYGGQKCSACSRLYVPESLWGKVKEGLLEERQKIKVGSPLEYDTFVSAVIDERSFKRIASYVEYAKGTQGVTILGGGKCDSSKGYFVEPTIIQVTNPKDKLITEEIFGPILAVYVYPDENLEETLNLVDTSTPYALTGAIFGNDREFLKYAAERLKMSAGNFYINDKSTGAVVGQQPFGGGRLSGTNDKAGGPHYLLRWTSPQAIKETFVPLDDWRYPYMKDA